MNSNPFTQMDTGEVNRRILAKAREENRADFSRVEAASIKRKTKLSSPEAKRLFGRCFYSFQININRISSLARARLSEEAVAKVEEAVGKKLKAATAQINSFIDQAGVLLTAEGIDAVATYDVMTLEEEVSIISPLSRRYFELIHKVDQLMPILQTLEIEEIGDQQKIRSQRSRAKLAVLSVAGMVRTVSLEMRNRMYGAEGEEHVAQQGRARQQKPAANAAPLPQSNGSDGADQGPVSDGTAAGLSEIPAAAVGPAAGPDTTAAAEAQQTPQRKSSRRAPAELPAIAASESPAEASAVATADAATAEVLPAA